MKAASKATVVGVFGLLSVFAASPMQAQGGGYMWCSASASNGESTTRYYSGVFEAAASEASAKAADFKSEVEDAEISAASVSARCQAAPDRASAATALANARNAAPGEALDWPN